MIHENLRSTLSSINLPILMGASTCAREVSLVVLTNDTQMSAVINCSEWKDLENQYSPNIRCDRMIQHSMQQESTFSLSVAELQKVFRYKIQPSQGEVISQVVKSSLFVQEDYSVDYSPALYLVNCCTSLKGIKT